MAEDGLAQGGKYAYNDDQETPNTLLASYDYGGREIVFEVRGLLTGGEGIPDQRRGGAPAAGAVAPPTPSRADFDRAQQRGADEHHGRQPVLRHRGLGRDERSGLPGVQGREQRAASWKNSPSAAAATMPPGLHMQNFLAACKSRNYKDLHDEIGNAYLSASLCHLANISYRTGRKLTLSRGTEVRERRSEQAADARLSQALRGVMNLAADDADTPMKQPRKRNFGAALQSIFIGM